ncbi:MAG TPA: asparagine synthase (glutamine-hydrolyzing), partial [Casimicrobiaceae bacterium]|nr:asparagine synthase (glutamine-hydrolyzing) [Casimicrobiaceae bacterium]
MCGIAGYVNLDGLPLAPESATPLLAAMGRTLHHRGPDDTRIMVWENVGFVFKRLSIVDLAGGAQPFETADGAVCAMVNGQIYNHREIRANLAHARLLRTRSDCEVIPYLYLEHDLALFDSVNGMFAIALLDRHKRRLLLARDRLGVKPLFYCIADGGRVLIFASELKGLFAHPAVPRVFDWGAVVIDNCAGEAPPREYRSGFEGIDHVPASAVIDVDLRRGSIAIKEYWSLPARAEPSERRPPSHYVDGYCALLEDSVRLRLMADVGYGLFLSGGVDSSTIAAIAARDGEFPTFSVLSQSTAGSGDAEAAHEVAAALKLPNHQVYFDEARLAVSPDDWRRILWHCELPHSTVEQLFKFYLHAFARERYPDLKVMLLGQGSDEFNGGYLSLLLGREVDSNPDDWTAAGVRLRAPNLRRSPAMAGSGPPQADSSASRALQRGFAFRPPVRPEARTTWELYVDCFRENLAIHLWHEDRTAAAHSIENRVPFLDYRLVEFLARVPLEHHGALFVNKQILRRAAERLLPKAFAWRPKGYFVFGSHEDHAFRMMHGLLRRNRGELVEQAIAGSQRTNGPLEPDGFRAFAAEVGRDPTGH